MVEPLSLWNCSPHVDADCKAGAFVAAPIGGLLWGLAAFGLRIGYHFLLAKFKGRRFDAFDRSPSETMGSFASREIPQSGNLKRDAETEQPDKQAAKASESFY